MSTFPRTTIGGKSVSRLMIGTNWFLGFSHTSKAKDRGIVEAMNVKKLTRIFSTFLRAGVDTLYGVIPNPMLLEAIEEAQQETGVEIIKIAIPGFPLGSTQADDDEVNRILDTYAKLGLAICMPHQCVTDALVNRRTKSLKAVAPYLQRIRERGMIPGLSTHMPEVPIYADQDELDVETYIQIYNAAGFLMQIEIDWVQRMIWHAKKPVITIKPLAAGRLPPLVGLAFSWSTIRPIDAICIGTSSAHEAEEVIEISLAVLENRLPNVILQETRSKASLIKNRQPQKEIQE